MKKPVILRGYLLIWIGISVVLAQDTTLSDSTTAGSSMSPTAETRMDTTGVTTNAGQSKGYTEDPIASPSSSQSPGDHETSLIPLKCLSFQCLGDHCYDNKSALLDSANATCPSYCEVYRHNSTFYENRCNEHCMHHMCNSTEQVECSIGCCNLSGCYNFQDMNNKANMTKDSKTTMPPVMSTTISTTTAMTTKAIQYSDKKCRSFTCSGTDCYKNQAGVATKPCQVGTIHCELQKKVTNGAVSYEGGCSNTCSISTKSCAAIANGDCFQECCNATSAGCCMKLDGQVHFNTAAHIQRSSLLRLFSCVFIVLFLSHYFSSSRVC